MYAIEYIRMLILIIIFIAESKMGDGELDWGRAPPIGQCSSRHLKPTLCSALRSMHPSLQLLHCLLLPHKLQRNFRGGLWWSKRSWTWPILFCSVPRNLSGAMEEGVTVVWNWQRPCHWSCLGSKILPSLPQMQRRMFCRWTLFANVCEHQIWSKECKQDVDLGWLGQERPAPYRVHELECHSWASEWPEDWLWPEMWI